MVRGFGIQNDDVFGRRSFTEMTSSNKCFALKRTDDFPFLASQFRTNVNDSFVARRYGTHADHGGGSIDGIAWKTSIWKTNREVREVGDRLFTHVVHAEGQTEVEQDKRMYGTIGKTEVCRNTPARVGGYGILKGRRKQGQHAVVDRHVPGMLVNCAWNEVVVVSAVADCVEHSICRGVSVWVASMAQPAAVW